MWLDLKPTGVKRRFSIDPVGGRSDPQAGNEHCHSCCDFWEGSQEQGRSPLSAPFWLEGKGLPTECCSPSVLLPCQLLSGKREHEAMLQQPHRDQETHQAWPLLCRPRARAAELTKQWSRLICWALARCSNLPTPVDLAAGSLLHAWLGSLLPLLTTSYASYFQTNRITD